MAMRKGIDLEYARPGWRPPPTSALAVIAASLAMVPTPLLPDRTPSQRRLLLV
jgi:hypothetical protein